MASDTSTKLIARESQFKDAWITVERLSVLLGLLAMAFVAGSNWHRIDALDTQMVETRKTVAFDEARADVQYARKDVLAEQLQAIKTQLVELKNLVEERGPKKP